MAESSEGHSGGPRARDAAGGGSARARGGADCRAEKCDGEEVVDADLRPRCTAAAPHPLRPFLRGDAGPGKAAGRRAGGRADCAGEDHQRDQVDLVTDFDV